MEALGEASRFVKPISIAQSGLFTAQHSFRFLLSTDLQELANAPDVSGLTIVQSGMLLVLRSGP